MGEARALHNDRSSRARLRRDSRLTLHRQSPWRPEGRSAHAIRATAISVVPGASTSCTTRAPRRAARILCACCALVLLRTRAAAVSSVDNRVHAAACVAPRSACTRCAPRAAPSAAGGRVPPRRGHECELELLDAPTAEATGHSLQRLRLVPALLVAWHRPVGAVANEDGRPSQQRLHADVLVTTYRQTPRRSAPRRSTRNPPRDDGLGRLALEHDLVRLVPLVVRPAPLEAKRLRLRQECARASRCAAHGTYRRSAPIACASLRRAVHRRSPGRRALPRPARGSRASSPSRSLLGRAQPRPAPPNRAARLLRCSAAPRPLLPCDVPVRDGARPETTVAGFDHSCVASSSLSARSDSTGNAGVAESPKRAAAGSVIQRGTLRSTPSGPRTVMGSSMRRELATTSNCNPAKGWNG